MLRAASLLALLGASAALLGCGGDSATPQTGDDAVLQFCVDETNRYRAMDGKGPIERRSALESFAATGAAQDTTSMQAHGHFGEQDPQHLVAFAENACPSWLGWSLGEGPTATHDAVAECLKAFYDEGMGGGHYENLMSDNAGVGCGFFIQNGGITIVQDFGR